MSHWPGIGINHLALYHNALFQLNAPRAVCHQWSFCWGGNRLANVLDNVTHLPVSIGSVSETLPRTLEWDCCATADGTSGGPLCFPTRQSSAGTTVHVTPPFPVAVGHILTSKPPTQTNYKCFFQGRTRLWSVPWMILTAHRCSFIWSLYVDSCCTDALIYLLRGPLLTFWWFGFKQNAFLVAEVLHSFTAATGGTICTVMCGSIESVEPYHKQTAHGRCLLPFCSINRLSFSSVKLQIQATSVGEVVIKGVCANRYLAMNRDGRLFGVVSEPDRRLQTNVTPFVFCKGFRGLPPNHRVAFPPRVQSAKSLLTALRWTSTRAAFRKPITPEILPRCCHKKSFAKTLQTML